MFKAKESKPCSHCGKVFYRDTRNTWAYWERARYCGQDCAGAAWRKAAAERRPTMRDNFERWIDKSGDCWLWTGATDKDGYGAFSHAGKTRRAHVVALELDGRKPKKGEYACHHCDNPQCVRPSHLYPGTPTQNMADARARGRTMRGERQHMAKLTEDAVRRIRAKPMSDGHYAELFGVTRGAVLQARLGRTWKHVQ